MGVKITDAESKIQYLKAYIIPGLRKAFMRGDQKYQGGQHFDAPRFQERERSESIRHILDFHVHPRMMEAVHAAEDGDLQLALDKLESAIGYITIEHWRTREEQLVSQ